MEEASLGPRPAPQPVGVRARTRDVARRYGLALLAPLAALLLRLGLTPWLGAHDRLLLLYLSLVVSAWYGGFGPGVVSTIFGALLADHFLVAPRYLFFPRTPEGGLQFLLFVGVGVLVSWLTESLHRARRGAEQTARALAESEARFRVISAHAPCLLWSAEIEDQGGELLFWDMKLANPEAAQRFFPLKVHPAQGYQHAWYLSRLAEDRLRTEAPGTAEIRAGRSYVQEFRCRREDGEIRWFSEAIQVETIAPGRWRAVGVCTDITERQQREAEVRERAVQLARADRAKDQFLAVLAHELRNPIGAISNAVQLLKLRAGADPRLGRPLEIMERQVDHQKHMLEDLLNVSRIVRGKISLHLLRLDLTQLLRDVAEDHRSALERAGLTLHCELPPQPVWVMGDRTRLTQVLGNLLVNAVKFTDPGGQVTVTLTVADEDPPQRRRERGEEKEGAETARTDAAVASLSSSLRPLRLCGEVQCAIVTVSDTGIGIEPELLPHVFESFIQAKRTQERSRGGLGLGLALVKGLVELHGGSVAAHSDGPGHGAAFTLHLPLADVAPTPEAGSPAAPRRSGAWRLLIVEDDPDAAITLQELLEALGCHVTVAYSGSEGIELAGRVHPEVVLCDLGLPGINGYEVAAQLRQHPVTASARLIAVSGYGQEEDRRRSQEAGFDWHLTKPLDIDELRRILELAPPCREEEPSSP